MLGEYKVDGMEKTCSSRLDRMDKRLGLLEEFGLLEESCSFINALVRTIQKATKSSSAPITHVV